MQCSATVNPIVAVLKQGQQTFCQKFLLKTCVLPGYQILKFGPQTQQQGMSHVEVFCTEAQFRLVFQLLTVSCDLEADFYQFEASFASKKFSVRYHQKQEYAQIFGADIFVLLNFAAVFMRAAKLAQPKIFLGELQLAELEKLFGEIEQLQGEIVNLNGTLQEVSQAVQFTVGEAGGRMAQK